MEINNFHEALATNLPGRIKELKTEVAELVEHKLDLLALIRDYEEMLEIARRRIPVAEAGKLAPPARSVASSADR